MGAVEVLRVKQLPVSNVGEFSFKSASLLDVVELVLNKRRVRVAFAVDESQNSVALFPLIFACEPAGGLWHEDHEEEEEDTGNHLDSPAVWRLGIGVLRFRRRDTNGIRKTASL
jgi:hypothetical protein